MLANLLTLGVTMFAAAGLGAAIVYGAVISLGRAL